MIGGFPLLRLTLAPSSFNGSAILSIGLLDKDMSPLRLNFLPSPDKYPVRSRIPVPEFPKYKFSSPLAIAFFEASLVDMTSPPTMPSFVSRLSIAAR